MGWTNSVQVAQRIMDKVLQDEIPHHAQLFLDDIGVTRPRTRYNEKEILPGVQKFIYEHFHSLNRTLYSLELAGMTAAGNKLQLALPGIKIVRFYCNADGCHLLTSHIIAILKWPV